jgi:branched-chain amino acid transport system ATP-binding protein
VAGLIRWSIGSIRFKGTELIGLPAHRIVELGIATVPEHRCVFGPMSVMENLVLGAFAPRARANTKSMLDRIFDLRQLRIVKGED